MQYFVLAQGTQVQTAQTQAAPAAQQTTAQEVAPDAAQQPQGFLSGLGGFLPMILIIGVMFYLMWRSQKKEQKRKEEMLNSIRKGSKVLTIGGIMGTISEVKEDCYVLELAENVKISVTKAAIGRVDNGNSKAESEKK